MDLLKGTDMVTFVRAIKNETKEDATKIRFASDVSVNWEKETDSVATMDGKINTVSDGETTAEITSYAYRDDEGRLGMWTELHDYYLNMDKIGLWIIMLTNDEGEELDAWYFEGRITTFGMEGGAEDQVELNMEMAIDGNGVRGTDTLTPEQIETLKSIDYEYKTVKQIGEA